MSLLSLALPLALVPGEALASTAVGVARPLIGLGVVAALIVVFKPLLVGLLRAALLVISPRKSLEQRNARRMVKSALMLHRMAREMENTSPGQAAELRWLASRGN
ncbi:MAG: hypothetical protein V7606_108 [Burkholderiales bacterium]|jgi:hypothetical protein|nr:hypothetical protein [Burkholderia sp.]